MANQPADMIRAITRILLLGAAAWVAAATVRYRLVEYEPSWTVCAAAGAPWWCTIRAAVTWGVGVRLYEAISIGAGLGALLTRWRGLAGLALVAGVVGAVLYRFELSAIGILAGALILAGARVPWPQSV